MYSTVGIPARPLGAAHHRLPPARGAGPTPFDAVALAGVVGWIVLTTTYIVGGAQLVIAVAIAAFLADRLFRGRMPDFGGEIGKWLIAYTATMVLTTPTSIWLGQSIGAIQGQAKLMLMFFLFVGCATTDKRREWLMRLTVVLLVLYPARGALLAQVAGAVKVAGRANWQGMFGNANMLAALLGLFLPFAIVWARTAKGSVRRLWWAGCAIVLTAATLGTQSRSGALGLAVVVGWVVLGSRNRGRAILLIGAVLVCAVVVSPTSVGERLSSVGYVLSGERPPEEAQGDVGNAQSRLLIWRAALDIIVDNPVVGVGPGTFEEAHRHYQRYATEWGAGALWIDSHNSFLRVWSETGTVGLIAFIGIFVVVFREGRRALRALTAVRLRRSYEAEMVGAALAGLAAFLVSNFFNTFKDAWMLYLHLAFTVLLIAHARRVAAAASAGGHQRMRPAAMGRRPMPLPMAGGPVVPTPVTGR